MTAGDPRFETLLFKIALSVWAVTMVVTFGAALWFIVSLG